MRRAMGSGQGPSALTATTAPAPARPSHSHSSDWEPPALAVRVTQTPSAWASTQGPVAPSVGPSDPTPRSTSAPRTGTRPAPLPPRPRAEHRGAAGPRGARALGAFTAYLACADLNTGSQPQPQSQSHAGRPPSPSFSAGSSVPSAPGRDGNNERRSAPSTLPRGLYVPDLRPAVPTPPATTSHGAAGPGPASPAPNNAVFDPIDALAVRSGRAGPQGPSHAGQATPSVVAIDDHPGELSFRGRQLLEEGVMETDMASFEAVHAILGTMQLPGSLAMRGDGVGVGTEVSGLTVGVRELQAEARGGGGGDGSAVSVAAAGGVRGDGVGKGWSGVGEVTDASQVRYMDMPGYRGGYSNTKVAMAAASGSALGHDMSLARALEVLGLKERGEVGLRAAASVHVAAAGPSVSPWLSRSALGDLSVSGVQEGRGTGSVTGRARRSAVVTATTIRGTAGDAHGGVPPSDGDPSDSGSDGGQRGGGAGGRVRERRGGVGGGSTSRGGDRPNHGPAGTGHLDASAATTSSTSSSSLAISTQPSLSERLRAVRVVLASRRALAQRAVAGCYARLRQVT